MAIPGSDIQASTFDTLRRAISPVSVWQFLLYVNTCSAHSCPEDIKFDILQNVVKRVNKPWISICNVMLVSDITMQISLFLDFTPAWGLVLADILYIM